MWRIKVLLDRASYEEHSNRAKMLMPYHSMPARDGVGNTVYVKSVQLLFLGWPTLFLLHNCFRGGRNRRDSRAKSLSVATPHDYTEFEHSRCFFLEIFPTFSINKEQSIEKSYDKESSSK